MAIKEHLPGFLSPSRGHLHELDVYLKDDSIELSTQYLVISLFHNQVK